MDGEVKTPTTLDQMIAMLDTVQLTGPDGKPVPVTADNVLLALDSLIRSHAVQREKLAALRSMRKALLHAVAVHAQVFED